MARRAIEAGRPAGLVKLAGSLALAAAVVAGCSGSGSSSSASPATAASASAAASTVASSAPSASPTPVSLPSGWSKYDVPETFSIALPSDWILITPTERDDTAAGAALEAKYPQYKARIEAGLTAMRKNSIPFMAFEPRTTGFATNIVIPKGTKGSPLGQEYVSGAATGIQESLGLKTAPTIETVSSGYRISWSNESNSTFGVSYLVGSGDLVYAIVLTTSADRSAAGLELGQQMASSMVIVP